LGLISLEKRGVRGDLIEVFKFINGAIGLLLTQIYFVDVIMVIEEAILRNCTTDEVDVILGGLCLEIG